MINYREQDFLNPDRWVHDVYRVTPKGWEDLPIEDREYCKKCTHPIIKGEACLYCHENND